MLTKQKKKATTIPQVQLEQNNSREWQERVIAHVEALPGIQVGASGVGEQGTRGWHIPPERKLGMMTRFLRPLTRSFFPPGPQDAFLIENEFAHLHQDGSMHMPLPPGLAQVAWQNHWALPHPLAGKTFSNTHTRGEQVMVPSTNSIVFGPRNEHELAVVLYLLGECYTRATTVMTH